MEFTDGMNWGVIYLVSEWVIRIVMLVVVPFRRSPEAAKGWLLLVLFLPWFGLLVYSLIGRPTYPRWRTERFARLPEAFRPMRERLEADLSLFSAELKEPLASTAALAQNLGGFRPIGQNEVMFLWNYGDAIDRLVEDIDNATNHVHLLYYIFADDAAGRKVLAALERAVKRGVVARVLVDAIGSGRWFRSLSKRMAAAGVVVHQVLAVGLLRRKSARADLRNHRKIAVIDGRVGYTGSQNLINSTFVPGLTFEETVVRAVGPVVLELQAVFTADWFMETEEVLDDQGLFPRPTAAGHVVSQALPSGPDYPSANLQDFLLSLIYTAKKRIVITTPYFIPDKSLLDALDTAVRRGVTVELVVSKKADLLVVSLAQKSYYEELLESGVRIHLYRQKFLHAKHVSVDDEMVVVGSSNMDVRSFTLNAEVNLIVFGREANARLREHQERCFAKSELLSANQWSKRRLPTKFVQNLARLMSPLL
jgi:cardiolipin synthase